MAPRKRISKIPSRVVAPEVVSVNGSVRSIGIQTDVALPAPVFTQPTKRQKIREKIKQLSKTKPEEDVGGQPANQGLPLSSLDPFKQPLPLGIVPLANEKACQVDEKELSDEGGTLFRLNADFGSKMGYLKNVVDMRRMESIMWDCERLNSLLDLINKDPPPRWAVASEMWLEVDKLENRLEAFEKEHCQAKNKT